MKGSLKDGRAKRRDGPGETGRLPWKSGSVARARIDNQGVGECLNRAPRGTAGLRAGLERHRVLSCADETGKLSTRIPNKRNNVCSVKS